MRSVLIHFVGVICLAIVVRTWIALGIIAPVFVSGDSMAPGLRGTHVSAACSNCGKTTSVGTAYLPAELRMACSWCDAGELNLAVPAQRGDRLLIDRTAFEWRKPQRWAPVVFHCPDGNRLCVKRVAGLPGETFSVRDGDLFVDGKRLVKTLAEQRRVRQLLPGQYLNYKSKQPITDANPYNSDLSRQLNRVHDFFLSVRVRAAGDGKLTVSGISRGHSWRIEIWPRSGKLAMHGEAFGDRTATLPPVTLRSFSRDGALLEVSTFDRQLLVAIDRNIVLRLPFAEDGAGTTPSDSAQPSDSTPPRLAVVELESQVMDSKLYRDLYYTSHIVGLPRSERRDWQLGADQWFLLGDNSPISIDSRVWGPVSGRLFVGKPLDVR